MPAGRGQRRDIAKQRKQAVKASRVPRHPAARHRTACGRDDTRGKAPGHPDCPNAALARNDDKVQIMTRLLANSAIALALSTTLALADGQAFGTIDTNDDGFLDRAELDGAFGAAGGSTLDRFDSNGDGIVSRDEAVAADEADDDDGAPTFDEIDLDADGQLEPDELEHVFGERAQAALAKFDADGDGRVTLDEVRSSDDPKGERGRDRSAARTGGKDRDVASRGRSEDRESRGRDRDREDRSDRGQGGKGGGNRGGNGGGGGGNGGGKGGGRGN
ncbi:hypothetical protein GCM10011324_35130 [Allosediminivita pacifica]|nr:hypothetical protein GCM10011324_35130 [Allosediminivita pacifica]